MNLDEAIKILDDVIPPSAHATVDIYHLPIAIAWEVVKEQLKCPNCGAKMDGGDGK